MLICYFAKGSIIEAKVVLIAAGIVGSIECLCVVVLCLVGYYCMYLELIFYIFSFGPYNYYYRVSVANIFCFIMLCFTIVDY